jgi:hypothetical protein
MSENSGERCGGPPAWSARVPQDPLPQALTNKQQVDVGVGPWTRGSAPLCICPSETVPEPNRSAARGNLQPADAFQCSYLARLCLRRRRLPDLSDR